ncbi:hypothetical protein ABH900_000350 [Stenotrophomonas sp. AN71]|uniref:hypothetical protein n=1 Tax=Stenotrophomonas sp. AN71 TaxID=3156253 RepID=UPI003D22A719
MYAFRSSQSLYWLILPFSFLLLDNVVYFLAIYFPEVRQSHGALQLVHSVKQLMYAPDIDPAPVVSAQRRPPRLAVRLESYFAIGTALDDELPASSANTGAPIGKWHELHNHS